jgi:hypothetical protein
MKPRYRVLTSAAVAVIVALAACSAWDHLQPPERAKTDSYEVWISLIKPFGRVVYYVGTNEPYAYFRFGRFFPSYYRSPACNFTLPRTFAVGSGNPYIVTQDNAGGYNSSPTCAPPSRDERAPSQGTPSAAAHGA